MDICFLSSVMINERKAMKHLLAMVFGDGINLYWWYLLHWRQFGSPALHILCLLLRILSKAHWQYMLMLKLISC